jgi:hypothetical protein
MRPDRNRTTLLLTLALATAAVRLGLAAPTKAEIEQAVAATRSCDWGQSEKPLRAVEKLARETHGNAELRGHLERQLAKLLESDPPFACKQFVCRQLWIIGTDRSVPALGKMLLDPDERIVEMACCALSRRPSPAADAALRGALSKARGKALAAIVRLLGERGDAQSAEAIGGLAASPDAAVADAAIAALSALATDRAATALAELRKAADPARRAAASHASLRCAQELAARGIGEHAKADLTYALEPRYQRFACVVGLDDQVARHGDVRGSIVVKVYLDEQVVLETPVLRGGGASASIDVEIPKGSKALRLVVDDAGDGVGYDDADFVNAGFILDPSARPGKPQR